MAGSGVGYAEGYLGALQQISGVQAQQQGIQAERLQMQQQQLKLQEEQYRFANDQQERSLLQQSFQGRDQQQQATGAAAQSDRLAAQYRDAGKRLMGVNPKDALAFLAEGDRLSHQNALDRLELAKGQKITGERLASLAASVSDQEGLDQYVNEAAQNGQITPPQYRQWSEGTAKYLDRTAKAAVPLSKQQELQLKEREVQLRAQDEQRKEKADEEKARANSAKEARQQASLEFREKKAAGTAAGLFKLKGKDDRETEIKTIADMDKTGKFKGLPAGVQDAIALDVRDEAAKAFQKEFVELDQEDRSTPAELLGKARENVWNRWQAKKESGFLGFGGKTTAERTQGGVDKPEKGDALPLPASKTEMQPGKTYNTARGPAKWNGSVFEALQ